MNDLRTELIQKITEAASSHPRSSQKMIGPSEIGTPCERKLAFKIAGAEAVNPFDKVWSPTIGVAVHSWLERAFGSDDSGRWIEEVRVMVGSVNGEDIWGTCDLYDTQTKTVIDWKVTTSRKIASYRSSGPGDQYRIQAHLYGNGFTRFLGNPTENVAIMFLPRDADITSAYMWTEPHDPEVGQRALARAATVAQLVGVGASFDTFATYDDYCTFCPFHRAGETTDVSCGGDQSIKDRWNKPSIMRGIVG